MKKFIASVIFSNLALVGATISVDQCLGEIRSIVPRILGLASMEQTKDKIGRMADACRRHAVGDPAQLEYELTALGHLLDSVPALCEELNQDAATIVCYSYEFGEGTLEQYYSSIISTIVTETGARLGNSIFVGCITDHLARSAALDRILIDLPEDDPREWCPAVLDAAFGSSDHSRWVLQTARNMILDGSAYVLK